MGKSERHVPPFTAKSSNEPVWACSERRARAWVDVNLCLSFEQDRPPARHSRIPRRYAAVTLAQKSARGDSGFHPRRITFHILQSPFDLGQNTWAARAGQSR